MNWKLCKAVLASAVLAAALSGPALAADSRPSQDCCQCPPPRFQVFEAPGTYGGKILLDTETGDSYQRIVVNSQKGITIRWLKLPRINEVAPGETVLWQ